MEWLRAETLRQTKLAFDDLVNQFNAAQNTPCVEEALETKHWSHAAFYPPVILFDDVVQVGTISNVDGIVPTVIEFVIHAHAPQSGMGGLEAIQGNYSRLAVGRKLAQSSLLIDDTAGLSISELRAKARRLKAQHDIQLIVIDYLQLLKLKGSSRRSQVNRQLEISEISAGIKLWRKS
jgi:DnaB-like helicase C terminal domain